MTLTVNILLTTLIITRLLLYRRAVMNALPTDYTKHYLSLATIIIESVFPYSIFGIAFIITYVLDNPMYRVFLYTATAAQVRISCCMACNLLRGLFYYVSSQSRVI